MAPLLDSPRAGLHSEAEVLDFANRALGPLEVVAEVTSPHSTHRVLACKTRSDEPVIVKWFADAPSFFHTLDALNNHAIALGHSAPKLIDHHEVLRAIVMSHVPGTPSNHDLALDPTVHLRVGSLLRQFHESAPTNRSSDLATSWATRLSGYLEELEPLIGDVLATEARSLALQLLDMEYVALSPIHGAIRPEHWLIDPDRGLHLIGYSHSEYDPWIVDTAILERDYWTYSPELKSAFYAGYEREPHDADLVLLRAKNLLDALQGWMEVSGRRSSKNDIARQRRAVDGALGGTLF